MLRLRGHKQVGRTGGSRMRTMRVAEMMHGDYQYLTSPTQKYGNPRLVDRTTNCKYPQVNECGAVAALQGPCTGAHVWFTVWLGSECTSPVDRGGLIIK